MRIQESPVSTSRALAPNERAEENEIASFNRRGLFVGGCPKSGTTLLLRLLDNHPQLVVFPVETHYLEERQEYASLRTFEAKFSKLMRSSEMPLLEETWRDGKGDYADSNFEEFVQLAREFTDQPGMNDSLLLSETIRAYAATVGHDWRECVRWVEKTPGNVPCSGELFRLFPHAKLIHILRDPRAVFASRRRLLLDRYGSYTKAHRLVREWNESTRQLKQSGRYAENYLVIHYEDLVRRSRVVMEDICRFIGIEYFPGLLDPTIGGKVWQGNSAYHTSFGGIDAHSLDQWKKELTEDEIWWIEMHCREGMTLAGYEMQTDAGFSLRRWARRLPCESMVGYLRARKSSLCQLGGLLKECRYDKKLRLRHSTSAA